MNRRIFIKAAVTSLAVPGSVLAARTAPENGPLPTGDYCFYDERFGQARQLAETLSGATRLTPVTGDITGVWNAGLKRACRESSLTMDGVTTESFYFCLKVMVQSHADLETQVTRINHDLYRWTIRSNVKSVTG